MPRRALMLLAVVLLATVAGGGVAHAAIAPDSRAAAASWTLLGSTSGVTSGEKVGALARFGDTLYLGGDFTGLARTAPGLATLEAGSGRQAGPLEELDRLDGGPVAVTAAVAASDGSVYVAGTFAGAGATAQPLLLRYTAAGRLDPAFAPEVTLPRGAPALTDLALSPDGRRLYVAGGFTAIGGQARSQLAAVDARTGAVSGWQPQVDGAVTRIVAAGDAVYVAGAFAKVRDAARAGLAALSAADATPTAFDPKPNAPNLVKDLAVRGSTVYVAGQFSTMQGVARPRLAAVDAATGAPTAWAPPVGGTRVGRIAVSEGKVYASGSFLVSGTTRQFAAFDRATGAVDASWTPALTREASTLAIDGGRVYVGSAGLNGGRCGLAAVDAASGALADWDPHLGTTASDANSCQSFTVSALLVTGGKVWAGGTFTAANVAPRSRAAAIDTRTGDLLPWDPGVQIAGANPPRVNAIAISADGGTVYLGGSFSAVGGQARGNLAAVAAAGKGAPLSGWGNAVNGEVRALALDPRGTRLYVGGTFTAVGQYGRLGLASVSATTGGVSAAWKPQAANASGAGASVRDLAVAADGTVYAAGTFAKIGFPVAVARSGLAAVVGDGASTDTGVATPFDAGLAPGTAVRSIALTGGRLYAAGDAGALGAGTSLAALDPGTGARVAAFAGRVTGAVYRVSADADGTVYVLGSFTRVAGADGVDVVRRNAGSFAPDGTPTAWDPDPAVGVGDPAPAGVLALPGAIVLGGSFGLLNGTRVQTFGLALFGPALAPVAGRGPTIAGTPALGQDLRCDPGRFGGSTGTSSWTWSRDGAPVDGATTNTYTIRSPDLGHGLACTQTLTNAAGAASATSDALAIPAPPPEPGSAPEVAGDTWAGGVATCTTGLWRNVPTAYAYQWLLDGAPLPGEDASAHAVGAAELGHALSCAVTATNAAGGATARSAPVTVTEPPPVNRGAPRVAGTPVVGATIACDAGTWDGAREFSYIWLRDGAAVDGRTGAAYGVTSRDLGHALECVVTARNAGGERSATSPAIVVTPSAHTDTIINRTPVPEVAGAAGAGAASIAKLDVGTATLARTGRRVVLRVAVPAAGTLTVRLVKGATTYGRATVKVKRRSTVTVRIALSARTAKTIRSKGAAGLVVSAAATLKPVKGATQKDGAKVRLRLTTATTIG